MATPGISPWLKDVYFAIRVHCTGDDSSTLNYMRVCYGEHLLRSAVRLASGANEEAAPSVVRSRFSLLDALVEVERRINYLWQHTWHGCRL